MNTIPEDLPTFDAGFPSHEQIPEIFEIEFHQYMPEKCQMRMNDVFIGAPLTDSIADPDGYRYHDVFHLAFAAILHWSPVFRALIQQKRRSDKLIDENQDGGRAIVIEEGLSAWLFSYAKEQKLFSETDKLPLDVLKNIRKFIAGYEVDQCPAFLWQRSILEGYKVFRQLSENNGGTVIGNRKERTIKIKI